jgi:glycosyltransferase involved in cell wall biosynthesis
MKILYIHETISGVLLGVGFLTHNACTIAALKKIGHEVVVLADSQSQMDGSDNIGKYRRFYRKINHYVPKRLTIIPRDIYDICRDRFLFKKKIEKAVKNVMPDIIFERHTLSHCAGVTVARKRGIPIIMEVHSPLEEKEQYFSLDGFPWYSRWAYGNAIAKAEAVIVVSSAMKKYICNWGVSEKKVHVIPNAAESDMFESVEPAKVKRVKDKYGLHGKKVIGFVGSMAPYHGLNDLIEAAREIIKEEKRVRFMLVGSFGDKKTEESVIEKISFYGLENFFLFTGSAAHSEIVGYIDCMDVCVIPTNSNWYGSPIKLFEYGARGKVVVACKLAPIEDIIDNGEDGILFDVKNGESLSTKLIYAVRNVDKTVQMGLRLQNKIKNKHTWLHNARKIQAVAENLI